MDEYLPHVLERVFVHGRILASCFKEGIRPSTNRRIFVERQTEHEIAIRIRIRAGCAILSDKKQNAASK